MYLAQTVKDNMTKLYDLVKNLLTKNEEYRSDDKKLIWAVWTEQRIITLNGFGSPMLYKNAFMSKAEMPDSITRVRRQVQKDIPSLKPTGKVKNTRSAKTYTYRDAVYKGQVKIYDPLHDKVIVVEKKNTV